MRLILNSFLLAASIGAALPAEAQYSTRCRETAFGGISCSSSDGDRYEYRSTPWGGGRSTYTDPYGRSTNCRTRATFSGYETSCY